MDMIKVITLDETEAVFYEWAKTVEEGANEPLIINKEHARKAAEAFFDQLQINRGGQPNIRRLK